MIRCKFCHTEIQEYVVHICRPSVMDPDFDVCFHMTVSNKWGSLKSHEGCFNYGLNRYSSWKQGEDFYCPCLDCSHAPHDFFLIFTSTTQNPLCFCPLSMFCLPISDFILPVEPIISSVLKSAIYDGILRVNLKEFTFTQLESLTSQKAYKPT